MTATLRGASETLVPNPTGLDIAAACNRSGDTAFALGFGGVCAEMAREAASSYCRGVGFEDDTQIPHSLRWVITLRAIRMASNSAQLLSQTTDGASIAYSSAAFGWTVHELRALDEYRRTACSI